jgi:uncharacterized damage-inducible protein DinB
MTENTMDGPTERQLLEQHLESTRGDVRRKLSGLDDELARRRLGVSATSAAGVVKHLTDVERWWFRHHLEGEDGVPFAWSDDVPDLEFVIEENETLAALLDDYDRACEESRAAAARHELDDAMVRPVRWLDGARPSLRWIYLHMIEETARHDGHLDIYRELLDGEVDRD